jgi:hypothetical protein
MRFRGKKIRLLAAGLALMATAGSGLVAAPPASAINPVYCNWPVRQDYAMVGSNDGWLFCWVNKGWTNVNIHHPQLLRAGNYRVIFFFNNGNISSIALNPGELNYGAFDSAHRSGTITSVWIY